MSVGYWGPVTSTIEWCERNYAVSYYVAEFWNTVSNSPMALAGLFGVFVSLRLRAELRFTVAFLCLALVGFGSALYHASLLFKLQLLDETPMLMCCCAFIYIVFENGAQRRLPRYFPYALALGCAAFIGFYVLVPNAYMFEAVYGVQVLLLAWRSLLWARRVDGSWGGPHVTMILLGQSMFLLAFVLWNIDNHLCPLLTRGKDVVGFPFSGVLELHAWWHVGTGIGTYIWLVALMSLRAHEGFGGLQNTELALLPLPHLVRCKPSTTVAAAAAAAAASAPAPSKSKKSASPSPTRRRTPSSSPSASPSRGTQAAAGAVRSRATKAGASPSARRRSSSSGRKQEH